MSEHDMDHEIVTDLSSNEVTTKYMTASVIVNKALQAVVDACVVGADIHELCQLGDKIVVDECGKIYNKAGKDGYMIEKGIAFPTAISPNDVSGHYSPLKGESMTLKDGDIVKIDMGCHIDGYITMAAHTIVVGGPEKITGKLADAMHACYLAAEGALREIKVGNMSTEFSKTADAVAAAFGITPLTGVLSHELKKNEMECDNVIAVRSTPEERVKPFQFEPNQVYCIDMVMSCGDGRCRESDLKTTIYRRANDNDHLLKTQTAKKFMAEVRKRSAEMPFCLRAFEATAANANAGISEAKRHGLVHEYPIIREKDGLPIVQFKWTVLILPSGAKKVTGLSFSQAPRFVTEKKLEGDLLKHVTSSMNPKKIKKKANAPEVDTK